MGKKGGEEDGGKEKKRHKHKSKDKKDKRDKKDKKEKKASSKHHRQVRDGWQMGSCC